MRILVTGGAGFIGSQVADAYLAAGHEVTVLDDLSTGNRANLNPAARFVQADVAGPQAAELVAGGGFDLVNHHAAQVSVPYSMEDPVHDQRVNALGTLNLIRAAIRGKVKRFIFVSSGGAVYGEQARLPIAEDACPRPASPYAAHKLLGEQYLAMLAAPAGLGWLVLRYANVYGPRQVVHAEAGVVVIFCRAIRAGRAPVIYRYPDQPEGMVRDYVYVGDVVRANLAALTGAPGRAYNIATGVPTTTLALWRALAAAAGVSAACSFGPPRPGDIQRSLLDWGLAARELGWRPEVDLARGLELTWAWQRGQKA